MVSDQALKLEGAAIEKKIAQLLDRIVESESRTVIGAYERKVEELEREKLVIAEKTARCGTRADSYDDTFRTAFEFLGNPWNLWENGTFEDKRIVLKLTLATHLEYDWNEGVRTAEISLPFRLLQDVCDREKVMAERVSPNTQQISATNRHVWPPYHKIGHTGVHDLRRDRPHRVVRVWRRQDPGRPHPKAGR